MKATNILLVAMESLQSCVFELEFLDLQSLHHLQTSDQKVWMEEEFQRMIVASLELVHGECRGFVESVLRDPMNWFQWVSFVLDCSVQTLDLLP